MKRIRFGALFIVCFINLAYAVEALAETSGEKFSMENIEQSTIADIKRFRKAAEQGNIDAQFTLGKCYYNGYGVTQSYTDAVKWYRKAAMQGDARAQNNLGLCYYNGEGVEQSYTEASK